MELNSQIKNNEMTIFIKGQVDTNTAPELEKEAFKEAGKIDKIVLNFENVDYVSSAGLRVILSIYKKQNEKNKELVLEKVNSDVLTILEMTGFTSFLTIK